MGAQGIAAHAPEQTLDAFIHLSQNLRWEQVPQATRTSVRRELLDHIGAAIAGRAAAGLPRWLKVLIDMGGRPDARVIGGPRVPAPTAALCNGYYGHVLKKSLAIGYVKSPFAAVGTPLQIEILGERRRATVLVDSPYDPENKDLKA